MLFRSLMRRAFFRLMLADLNAILDGLTELEEKDVETIDCRRAQFSAQEPIIRLRMICQSWKVMFQAEYSSGQPLRMLVDLRASVDEALGRGSAPAGKEQAAPPPVAPRAAAAAAGAGTASHSAAGLQSSYDTSAKPQAKFAVTDEEVAEFEISAEPQDWSADADPQPGKMK